MKYEEIYSRSYMKKTDPNFFKNESFAKETMCEWLHEIAAFPYVRDAFASIEFNDELEELTYQIKNTIDDNSDAEFVKKLFSDAFVICWMRPQIDSSVNMALIIGGKDEKKLQSNYAANVDRLEKLEIKLKKYIRDYGYHFGSKE